MQLFLRFDFFSVLANSLSRPDGKRPQERTYLLITKQECNILGGHFGVCKVGFRQQLPSVVELLLEVRVFLSQLPLERALAVT